jgi:hypothetical protein
VTPSQRGATGEVGAKPSAAPLWRLLQAAAGVVAAVVGGQSATAAISSVEGDLRPGAQALAFQALRQLGRAQALRHLLARRPPPPPADALLCTALALCWRDGEAPYEVFTLVDQCVEAAKRGFGTRAQANFINACLRRFLREREALVAATEQDAVAHWNHPRWWIERLKRDHPQKWQQILQANNMQPPMTLRVNARKSTVAQYLSRLQRAGVEATQVGEYGVILRWPVPVHDIPGFVAGEVSVQDAAAQLAAPLLLRALEPSRSSTQSARRILDARAAPAGARGCGRHRAGHRPGALPPHRGHTATPGPASSRARSRRGAARAVVGRPDVRRDPARCPLHRVGHRAPPSGHTLAAARKRYRATRGAAGALAGRAVALAQARRFAAVLHLFRIPRGG